MNRLAPCILHGANDIGEQQPALHAEQLRGRLESWLAGNAGTAELPT